MPMQPGNYQLLFNFRVIIETSHNCDFVIQKNVCGMRSCLCFLFCFPCWLGGTCCNGTPCYCWDV